MTSALSATEYQRRLAIYARDGEERAIALGNRGPIRLDEHGKLHSDITRAYWEHGFYVFTNALSNTEVNELRDDVMPEIPQPL